MSDRKSNAQKNTLLKNAQANAESNFFKRVFFSQLTVSSRTDITSNLYRFGQSVCKLDKTHPRTDRRATDNKGLAKVAVQWLIEHLCFVSSVVQVDSFVLRIRHLRQAQKRYRTANNKV